MDLPQEQIQNLKQQIIDQINSKFPEDQKQQAIQQVNSMGDSEFVNFLKNNNLIPSDSEIPEQVQNIAGSSSETPFRQIVQGKIPSYKISENNDSIAVLEINPISVGHTIIIPKNPVHDVSSIPNSCQELAENLSKVFKKELNPKDIIIKPSSVLGEIIINVLPVYENETLESQRTQAKEEELQSIKEVLETPSIQEEIVEEKEISESEESPEEPISETNTIIPKRIP